jgi:predicted CopG family antitoxin
MADCKIISAIAREPKIQINDGAKEVNANFKEIFANISAPSISPVLKAQCIDSSLTGYGEEWVPDSRLFNYSQEILNALDVLKANFRKKLEDAASISETFSKKFKKQLVETATTSDTISFVIRFGRLFAESAVTSEKLAKYSRKPFFDNYLANDTVAKRMRPLKVDNASFSEVLVKHVKLVLDESDYFLQDYVQPDYESAGFVISELMKFSIRKNLNEVGNIIESIKIRFTTPRYDSYNVSDKITLHVKKYFKETVTSTDDFLGEASVDDDQTMVFKKVTEEYLVSSERLQKVVQKTLQDSGQILEIFSKLMKKTFGDSVAGAEVIIKYLDKNIVENTTFSETLTKLIKRAINETALMTETIRKTLLRGMSDSYVISEFVYKKLSKTFTESSAVNDVSTRDIKPNKVETIGLSELTTANLQGYFLERYVIPGYVGTNYTF